MRSLFIFLAVLCTWSHALAAPYVKVAERNGAALLMVNGRETVRLVTSAGGAKPTERMQKIAERLSQSTGAVWYKKVGSDAQIMVGNSLLITATSAEAAAQKTTAVKLAEDWVRKLKDALAVPPVSASTYSLLIPLGETREVKVQSIFQEQITAQVTGSGIQVDGKKPGSLLVTGLSVGNSAIDVSCGGFSARVDVAVRKYAGRLASGATEAVVTGPAPAGVIAEALTEAAGRGIALEPGASIRKTVLPQNLNIAPGSSKSVSVELDLAGPNYIPAKISLPVKLENRLIPRLPTTELLYSNNPERLLRYGTLFTAKLESAGRLLYHHQNMMGTRVGFVIDLVNTSDRAAQVHIIKGVSEPMVDTIVVGYKAGVDFLAGYGAYAGRVIEIQAGTRAVILSQGMDAGYTASGIIELRRLSGDPLLVRVMAKPEVERETDSFMPAGRLDTPSAATSGHVYPGPAKTVSATYTAGSLWTFVRIGNDALQNAASDMQLYGNYGVVYDIELNMENPGSTPHRAELAFEATAGPSSAVFVVDGKLIGLRFVNSLDERRVTELTIPPGGKRTVTVRTIPLSGSAYPATLIVRPVR
ncbi:MAG: hypothetical protein ACYC2Y_07385 [Armatimonadota bacterium]